jgi:hypothetical protein
LESTRICSLTRVCSLRCSTQCNAQHRSPATFTSACTTCFFFSARSHASIQTQHRQRDRQTDRQTDRHHTRARARTHTHLQASEMANRRHSSFQSAPPDLDGLCEAGRRAGSEALRHCAVRPPPLSLAPAPAARVQQPPPYSLQQRRARPSVATYEEIIDEGEGVGRVPGIGR